MNKFIEWATYGKLGKQSIEPVEKDPFEDYVGTMCSGTLSVPNEPVKYKIVSGSGNIYITPEDLEDIEKMK